MQTSEQAFCFNASTLLTFGLYCNIDKLFEFLTRLQVQAKWS